MKRNKILFSVVVALVIMSLLSISSFADTYTAYDPTYVTKVNGQTVNSKMVKVINDETYIHMNALIPFGIIRNWTDNGTERIADYTVPQVAVIPDDSTETRDLTSLSESIVKFYRGNGKFLGNGIITGDYEIIAPAAIEETTVKLVVKTHKGKEVALDNSATSRMPRVIKFKSKDKLPQAVKVAKDAPKAGDMSILVGSINQVSNYFNFGEVSDPPFYDYNWSSTGMNDFLRTLNNVDASSIGSGVFNDSGELIGMYFVKQPNGQGHYALSFTQSDINDIINP